jgi:hypothetical protein
LSLEIVCLNPQCGAEYDSRHGKCPACGRPPGGKPTKLKPGESSFGGKLEPGEKVAVWRCDDAETRVASCIKTLSRFNFITSKEKNKIEARYRKWASSFGHISMLSRTAVKKDE